MDDKTIAFVGNPNVGKSTLFNALTGLNQHTGNWPGKTVERAEGRYVYKKKTYCLVDLPGTYSLKAHSLEEEVARDFICFGEYGCIVIVCDATCLERNLNLVYQTLEITNEVIVCVNLLDEAKRKNISVDIEKLSKILKVPVIATSANQKKGIDVLQETIHDFDSKSEVDKIDYPISIEYAIDKVLEVIPNTLKPNPRWIALRLLEDDCFLKQYTSLDNKKLITAIHNARRFINEEFHDNIIKSIIKKAEITANTVVSHESSEVRIRDRKLDHIFTSKRTGIPIMILLLCLIFWMSIYGANIPSQYLSDFLFSIENILADFLLNIHVSSWIVDMLVHGMYRVLAWVVSVMLPPMAIFFPLFTLLEDFGYLPRIAFNLDYYFKKAHTCGKQALTMCMGFGCNAAGVTGCRIIDSPREQIIAMVTNSFVPCNGRFPTLITLITIFFVGIGGGFFASITSALLLTCIVILGIVLTFVSSKILSKTVLKGIPSSFTLELPSYRKPLIGKVIVRSIFDRTLFVLARAMSVAAPAGLLLWILANVNINEISLLTHIASFLNPFGKALGMDGVIILAFILGFPANEIVIPIIIMAYMSQGTLIDIGTMQLSQLLISNGWTYVTALCTIVFCLLHWPCSTTLLTIKKETQSLKWTLLAFILPTTFGIIICFLIASIARIFQFI